MSQIVKTKRCRQLSASRLLLDFLLNSQPVARQHCSLDISVNRFPETFFAASSLPLKCDKTDLSDFSANGLLMISTLTLPSVFARKENSRREIRGIGTLLKQHRNGLRNHEGRLRGKGNVIDADPRNR